MNPIALIKVIFNPLINPHLIADTGAMRKEEEGGLSQHYAPNGHENTIYTRTSKLPFRCISMSASLSSNTSFKKGKIVLLVFFILRQQQPKCHTPGLKFETA